MARPRNRPVEIDPDDYSPLYDPDFIDDDMIQDDRDLADIIGDERMRRRGVKDDWNDE